MDFNEQQVCSPSPEGMPCGHQACRCAMCSCGTMSACTSPTARKAAAASGVRAEGGRRPSQRRVLLKCFGIVGIASSFMHIGVADARAQIGEEASRAFSISLTQTRPGGEMGTRIGSGYGVSGAFLLPLDRDGFLSLRAEVGAVEYGHELKRTAFSESVGGRVEVNVRTTHALVPGSVGLQLAAPSGPVRPYVNGGIGLVAFYTDSRVQPTAGGAPLASTVNQWDAAPMWAVGGGLYIPLSMESRKIFLDVGAQYLHGGRVEYLAPGSIVDLPDGRVTITPLESETRILALRVGARIGR